MLELIISMAMVGVISIFLADFLFYEVGSYKATGDLQDSVQDANWALEKLARDLRQITSADSILQASQDSLRFYDVTSTMISYQFDENEITRNGEPLLSSVSSFSFQYYDQSGDEISQPVADPTEIHVIEVAFATERDGATLPLSTKVHPRNF